MTLNRIPGTGRLKQTRGLNEYKGVGVAAKARARAPLRAAPTADIGVREREM